MNPAWGWSTRTQLSPSRCHVLIVIVTLADRQRRADALATAAEEDDWPVQESYSVDQPLSSWIRVLGRSRRTPTPSPSTDHRVVSPSRYSPGRRRQIWSPVPAWPGCGTRGPSFRHHGSAVDRRDPAGTAGDHRKGSCLERSPRSPGSGELSCRWQECFSRVQTVRSDPV